MMWGSEIRPWFASFLCKILPKRLKFSEFDIYMFKVKKKRTRTRYEICSKLTIKTPKRCQFCRSGVFTVDFEIILFYTLLLFFYVNSEQVNAGSHLLYSLPYIQKQSPRVVFQERCSTFSQFKGEHRRRNVSSTLLKSHFCMGILLKR